MTEAGINRSRCYLTNAVKHFKFEQRGKRRIHQKPTAGEVKHYRWWLDKELALVAPRLIVALGATAVLALAGKSMPVTRFRAKRSFSAAEATSPFIHPICFAFPTRRPSAGPMTNLSMICEPSAPSPPCRAPLSVKHRRQAKLQRLSWHCDEQGFGRLRSAVASLTWPRPACWIAPGFRGGAEPVECAR
jgi:hypothetical protein